MKKTEQVRLPADLLRDARWTAPLLGETVNDYIARIVREALRRDMPKASKLAAKRTEQAGQDDTEGGK